MDKCSVGMRPSSVYLIARWLKRLPSSRVLYFRTFQCKSLSLVCFEMPFLKSFQASFFSKVFSSEIVDRCASIQCSLNHSSTGRPAEQQRFAAKFFFVDSGFLNCQKCCFCQRILSKIFFRNFSPEFNRLVFFWNSSPGKND